MKRDTKPEVQEEVPWGVPRHRALLGHQPQAGRSSPRDQKAGLQGPRGTRMGKLSSQEKETTLAVWLTGVSTGLQIKRLQVRLPVRVHAWVVGQAPSLGRVRGNLSMYLSHIRVSLSPSPSLPYSLKK